MNASLLLCGSASCPPFCRPPQTLGLSKETSEQCICEIEQIERVCFSQSALVRSVVTVLMDGGRKLAEVSWETFLIEQPRKTHTQISSRPAVDAYCTFRWEEGPSGEIQRHAEHSCRRIPTANRDALCSFVESILDAYWQMFRGSYTRPILEANKTLNFKIWRNINIFMDHFSIYFVAFRIRFIAYTKYSSGIALTADRICFVMILPPILLMHKVKVQNIECHTLCAAPWAASNDGSHSNCSRNCHSKFRRLWHVSDHGAVQHERLPRRALSCIARPL